MSPTTAARITISALFLTLFVPLQNQLHAAEIRIFAKPPSPDHLADILFAPRYRSAKLSADDTENRFGMMINFKLDSTKVLAESVPMLDSVGKMLSLERVRDKVLVIEGHTDVSGTERHNDNLSVRRAQAIKSYLIGSYDVDPARLVTIGHGETLLHDATTPTNPINRRVEFRSLDAIVVH